MNSLVEENIFRLDTMQKIQKVSNSNTWEAGQDRASPWVRLRKNNISNLLGSGQASV